MTVESAAPALSLTAASLSLLTETKLVDTRWHMGLSGRGELTSSFHFGADGQIKVFKSSNEATWRLRDGVLEIFDERGALAWHFDLVFQLGDGAAGQLVLFSGYRKPTMDIGVSLYLLEHHLLEHRQADPVVAAAVVEAADNVPAASAPAKAMTVCVRGARDMAMTADALGAQVNVVEELSFADQGWGIGALPRIIALRNEVQRPENREIIARLPGVTDARFESELIAGAADAYVLSFAEEALHGLYQSRSTGMIIPMEHAGLGDPATVDYTQISHEEIIGRGLQNISAEQWAFFREEFIFRGGFNEALFMMDVIDVFTLLKERGKQVLIVGLNAQVGRDKAILAFFGKINAIVRPLAAEFGFSYIDVHDFITGESDLAADRHFGGRHFAREVYLKISEAILAALLAPRHMIADAA